NGIARALQNRIRSARRMRRCPPAVLNAGILPSLIHRITVIGVTRQMRAASCVLNMSLDRLPAVIVPPRADPIEDRRFILFAAKTLRIQRIHGSSDQERSCPGVRDPGGRPAAKPLRA